MAGVTAATLVPLAPIVTGPPFGSVPFAGVKASVTGVEDEESEVVESAVTDVVSLFVSVTVFA